MRQISSALGRVVRYFNMCSVIGDIFIDLPAGSVWWLSKATGARIRNRSRKPIKTFASTTRS